DALGLAAEQLGRHLPRRPHQAVGGLRLRERTVRVGGIPRPPPGRRRLDRTVGPLGPRRPVEAHPPVPEPREPLAIHMPRLGGDRQNGPPMTAIRVEDDGAVRRLVLCRPAEYNTITPGLRDELGAALDAAERDDGVRVVLLSAEGPAFCAGFGLDWSTAGRGAAAGGGAARGGARAGG